MLAFATMSVLGSSRGWGWPWSPAPTPPTWACYPRRLRIERFLARFSLERGLVLGGVLLLLGAGCFVAALSSWGASGFGALDVVQSMRVPIIGMVLTVSGFQLITVSFTLSLTRIGED